MEPAIIEIVRATRPGLVGQEGTHPTSLKDGFEAYAQWPGGMITLNVIIAGTNPLATDMVAAKVMGFEPEEIPTFDWAWKAGMQPTMLDDIEIRVAELAGVTRRFERATDVPYSFFRDCTWWCTKRE